MISASNQQEYYQALLEKKSEYEGVFYVGVKTTGVFCRPTCPARKPKIENCEFLEQPKKRCLLPTGPANDAGRFRIPIRCPTWFGCL